MFVRKITDRMMFISLFYIVALMAGMSCANYLNSTGSMRGGLITALFFILALFSVLQSVNFQQIPRPLLLLLIFTLVFVPRLMIVLTVEATPWNDFSRTLDAAVQLAAGDFSGVYAPKYSVAFPNALPWITFEAAVVKVFGSHAVLALKMMNCLACGTIGLCLFLMGRHFSDEIGLLAALIYAFYPSSILFSAVLSNQHISAALEYCALTLILAFERPLTHNKRWPIKLALAGLLFGLGQLIRPDALPAFAAALIYTAKLAGAVLTKQNLKKGLILSASALLLLAIPYFLTTKAANTLIQTANIYPYPNMSFDMGYKFYVGLNSNNGSYLLTDEEVYFNADPVEREALVKDRVVQQIRRPYVFAELLFRKFSILWGQDSKSFFWLKGNVLAALKADIANNTVSTSDQNYYNSLLKFQSLFTSVNSGYYSVILLFALAGVYRIRRQINHEKGELIFWVTLFYVGVFLFIEVQGRYRYFLEPVLILLAAIGIPYCAKMYRLIQTEIAARTPPV